MLHLLAAEAGSASTAAVSSGWVTRHVWLIFLLPTLSFVITLAFGKRMPTKGTEPGLLLVGAALVLSLVLGAEWLGRSSVELTEKSPAAITATYRHTAAGDTATAEAPAAAEPAAEPAAEAGHEAEPVHVRPYYESEKTWFMVGPIHVGFGFHVDGYTVVMLITVCIISFLVHLYSTEYLRDDRRKTHYFAALGLFTAGMLEMVAASTTLQLLLGWEIMGLCSFMLIGHWWEESKNSTAALKAFFTTRTGDVGLLVGISTLFFGAGQTFNIATINQAAILHRIPRGWLVCAAVALFIACIGKSAQFPLHTWLPDAMAGPTPASSLIHAATMVVAGVYMVGRLYPVFFTAFRIGDNANLLGSALGGINPIAIIGGTTLLIAGVLAFVQQDIKKVLAYSTVSQLGYMVMALGVGGWTAGIFHLFTHAFFKALLFMGAGSLSHSCFHSFDMRDYGGLRKHMPKTYWTFVVGFLGLIGFPLIGGFWSKDEILLSGAKNGYGFFLGVGTLGAMLTAAYMTRVMYKTFFGEYTGPHTPEAVEHAEHAEHEAHAHLEHEPSHASTDPHVQVAAKVATQAERGPHDDEVPHGHGGDAPLGGWPHESPWNITVPLQVLAVLTVVGGLLGAPALGYRFAHFLLIEPVVAAGVPEHPFSWAVGIGTTFFPLLALGLSYLWWWKGVRLGLDGLTERSRVAHALYTFVERKYYLDDLYEKVIVHGITGPISAGAYWVNQNILDGVVNGVGTVARRAATFTYETIDQKGVDGAVNGIGAGATGLGRGFKAMSTGKVQQYAAFLLGGAAAGVLVIIAITFSRR